MDPTQAFHRCLRTLARTPRCQNIASASRTQPSSRRKHDPFAYRAQTRAFSSSERRQGDADSSKAPKTPIVRLVTTTNPPSGGPSSPSPSTKSAPPPRSRRNLFEGINLNPAGTRNTNRPDTSQSQPAPDAATRKANIRSLVDDAFGLKDIIPPSKPKQARTADTNSLAYDAMSAYEGTTRPRRPSASSPSTSLDPTSSVLNSLNDADLAADYEASLRLRLKPTLGRSVPVDLTRNVDLTRAFRLLEAKNAQNNVKQDSLAQKTHVRKGQMRKIMRRRRWRKTFLAGFLEECARVRRMRRQGW